jgi:hypothetical protein
MPFPPFDVMGIWVKPVVAGMTGVSALAKRKAAMPRRDQRAGSASAPLSFLTCELSTIPSPTAIVFYLIKHNLVRQAIAKRA